MNSTSGNRQALEANDSKSTSQKKPVKRTYSKTTGNNSFDQMPPTTVNTHLSFADAPTSLANLAQLSGITLVPIGNFNPVQLIQPQKHVQSHCNQSFSAQSLSQQQRSTRQPNFLSNNQATRLPSNQPHSIFNLASVQSLDQITRPTSLESSWQHKTNDIKNGVTGVSQSAQPRLGGNKKSKQPRSKQQQQSCEVPIIPLNEALPLFSDMNDRQPVAMNNYDVLNSQLDSDSISSNDQTMGLDGDLNNISLIKLMAILNNPALTITAVNNTNSNSRFSDNYEHVSSPRNLIEDHPPQVSKKIINNYQNPSGMNVQSKSSRDYPCNISQAKPKNRIPQSSTNIQVLCGGGLSDLSTSANTIGQPVVTTSRGFNNIAPTNNSINRISLNSQLDWLSNKTKNIPPNQKARSVQTSQIDHGPFNNDKFNEECMDPSLLSTSVKNLMMQQQSHDGREPCVSVHLLKHIANQAKDNDWQPVESTEQQPVEPVCILPNPPRKIKDFIQGVKIQEKHHNVTVSISTKKSAKSAIQTAKDRLFIPCKNILPEKSNISVDSLLAIDVEVTNQNEVYLSEHHSVLNSMMPQDSNRQVTNTIPGPDDIFINRSKRVMSYVDTMVERKKRKRFERISGSGDQAINHEEQSADSEAEFEDCDEKVDWDSFRFIKTHLPLTEPITEKKRSYFSTVGLVPRYESKKLELEQYEAKKEFISPLALEDSDPPPKDVVRFVDMILKTGGENVQLRVETNIKRNDLPLIEGLNRTSSRVKVGYMNGLGLEKRSKRTTLYKMKPNDSSINQSNSAPKPTEDVAVSKNSPVDRQFLDHKQATKQPPATIIMPKQQIPLISCRDAMKPPSKNEYMKSLGLIAS